MGLDFPIDPETLRETVADSDALAARLSELAAQDLDDRPETRAEYATLLRIAGRLDEAVLEAELTLAAADMSGDLHRMVRAQLLVGHARQYRGEWTQADTMFHRAEKLALYLDDDALVAAAAHHSGRSFYDQGKHVEAALRFRLALEINERTGSAKAGASREALKAAMGKL
jgi:tetratricopeptide (TPR) repeat protein